MLEHCSPNSGYSFCPATNPAAILQPPLFPKAAWMSGDQDRQMAMELSATKSQLKAMRRAKTRTAADLAKNLYLHAHPEGEYSWRFGLDENWRRLGVVGRRPWLALIAEGMEPPLPPSRVMSIWLRIKALASWPPQVAGACHLCDEVHADGDCELLVHW